MELSHISKAKGKIFESPNARMEDAEMGTLVATAQSGDISKSLIVDVNEAIAFPADTYLTIPCPDSQNQPTHPSVKYFPQKWNDYYYWMAFTPYTGSDSQYENPCILCSNDKLNWVVPTGLTNPIYPKPTTGYNSDTNLCMSPNGKIMYLIWRTVDTKATLWVSESTDGVNWSAKQQILQTVVATEELASPGVIWDGKQYAMWVVDLAASPKVVKKRTATSIYGPWSDSITCTINTIPSGKEVWHIEIINLGNQILMIPVIATPGGFGFPGQLYLASSLDGGVTWTLSNDPVLALTTNRWDNSIYKSTGIVMIKNGEVKIGLWYPGKNIPWRLGFTEITFNKSQLEVNKDLLFFKSINKINPSLKRGIVIADNFARVDDATGLNTSNSGHMWTNSAGVIGISGGLAYAPTATNNRALVDVGSPNFEAWVEVNVNSSENYLIFRFQDSSNFWRLGYRGGGYFLDKIGGSGGNTTITLTSPFVSGDRFWVKCVGDNITAKVISNNGYVDFTNGMVTLTDPLGDTMTKVGIGITNTTSRISKFYAKAL